ncbi:MAG: AAA family ATPase, partial [Bacteroidota bacterium]
MKELPIGIQSIEKILGHGNCVYIDKTPFAYQLIKGIIPHYFLSRPRRFGKSLFLDTLAEIFKGNKELFKTCAIYQTDYDWKPYPVLSLSLSGLDTTTPATLKKGLTEALEDGAALYGLTVSGSSLQSQLKRLITAMAKQAPVAVLIDEYDAPITAHLDNAEIAQANRAVLRDFFGTLKNLERSIKFTFITGISRFSKVSLFSEANHLKDVTMHPDYAAIAGYTEDELRQAFEEHIEAIARGRGASAEEVLTEIKAWYNGYRFSEGETFVYNPFSTLKYMETRKAESHWYVTGTPAFLL